MLCCYHWWHIARNFATQSYPLPSPSMPLYQKKLGIQLSTNGWPSLVWTYVGANVMLTSSAREQAIRTAEGSAYFDCSISGYFVNESDVFCLGVNGMASLKNDH